MTNLNSMRTDLFDFELPPDASRCARRSPRDSARMLVVQPGAGLQDRNVADLPQWLRARRPARRQRHQGDRGPAHGPPHRPRDRTEDRGDADQAARRLALAGAGQAGKKLAPGDIVRFGNEGRVCLLGHLDARGRGQGRGRRGHVVVFVSRPGAGSGHRRSRRPPLPPYIASQARARRARRRRLPDHVRGQ